MHIKITKCLYDAFHFARCFKDIPAICIHTIYYDRVYVKIEILNIMKYNQSDIYIHFKQLLYN